MIIKHCLNALFRVKSFPSSKRQTTTGPFTNSEQYSILWHMLPGLILVEDVFGASDTQTKTLKDHKLHRNSWVNIPQACQKIKNSQDKIPIRLEEMGIWENAVTDIVPQVTKACCLASTCKTDFWDCFKTVHLQNALQEISKFPLQEQEALLEGIPRCLLHFLDMAITVELLCAFGPASFIVLLIPSIHQTILPLEQSQRIEPSWSTWK